EQQSHRGRIARLVAQDPEITQDQMKEFRMQLEHTLELSEAKERQTRRRIVLAGATYLLALFGVFCLLNWRSAHQSGAGAGGGWPVYPLLALYVALFASLAIGVLLVVTYLLKYLPRLSRARYDLQAATMAELQQQ